MERPRGHGRVRQLPETLELETQIHTLVVSIRNTIWLHTFTSPAYVNGPGNRRKDLSSVFGSGYPDRTIEEKEKKKGKLPIVRFL